MQTQKLTGRYFHIEPEPEQKKAYTMPELTRAAIEGLQEFIYQGGGGGVQQGDIVAQDGRAVSRTRLTPQEFILGKPTQEVVKGQFSPVEIWTGSIKGGETPSGHILPNVYCRTQDLSASDFVYVYLVQGGLEMNRAIC